MEGHGPIRVAALVKQVPTVETMALGPEGRLVRDGVELEMSAYCRRAVSKAVELALTTGGHCLVITLGPPSAEDVLREALAWGADDALLVSDPAFAGSDSLATALALAAALRREGPFDLVLVGRNSIDADTGQVGPQLAELLELPFAGPARSMALGDDRLVATVETDAGRSVLEVRLPAIISVAERLCAPAKVDQAGRAAMAPGRVRQIGAGELGPGPWGQQASPTRVGEIRRAAGQRQGVRLGGPVRDQVEAAMELLEARQALSDAWSTPEPTLPPGPRSATGPAVAALLEPGRPGLGRELLAGAWSLASEIGGHVTAVMTEGSEETGGQDRSTPEGLCAWGADVVIWVPGGPEEDVAARVAQWAEETRPWAILGPSTLWGRHVMSRVAVRRGAGLVGDAVGVEVQADRLVAWKPAFGGQVVAAIRSSSHLQMVTVRPGTFFPGPRRELVGVVPTTTLSGEGRARTRLVEHHRDDDPDALAAARTVIGIGRGVALAEFGLLEPLRELLGAELAATRKVTDEGWLPRSRQVGLTGRAIAPRLYLAIGLSGKANHAVGIRQAGTVLAVNLDPGAPVFEIADIGIVADWRQVLPVFAEALQVAMAP